MIIQILYISNQLYKTNQQKGFYVKAENAFYCEVTTPLTI